MDYDISSHTVLSVPFYTWILWLEPEVHTAFCSTENWEKEIGGKRQVYSRLALRKMEASSLSQISTFRIQRL
jgi:hypothetical protein